MEILLERVVQGEIAAAVCRRDGELVVTGDLRGATDDFAPLESVAQVVRETPSMASRTRPR